MVRHDLVGAMDALLRRLEDFISPDAALNPDYYGWVSLPYNEFFTGLEAATAHIISTTGGFNSPRFLDVGSGIGTKMIAAELAGYRASGIEVVPEYSAVARRLIPDADITDVDAFDYTGYDQFDVVYAYHPCSNVEFEKRLEAHVISHMRPGALLFLTGTDPDPAHGLHAVDAHAGVWLVG